MLGSSIITHRGDDMTWRIIKQGWEGCDALSDTRFDIIYGYEELDGAKYVTSNDVGEVCFQLEDERIAWLVSTDLEFVQPFSDNTLSEPYFPLPDSHFVEHINYVHCVFQELEAQGVSLPMGDYNLVYGYLEDVRDLLDTGVRNFDTVGVRRQ